MVKLCGFLVIRLCHYILTWTWNISLLHQSKYVPWLSVKINNSGDIEAHEIEKEQFKENELCDRSPLSVLSIKEGEVSYKIK